MRAKMKYEIKVAETREELEEQIIELLKDDWILDGDISLTYDSFLSGTNQSYAYYQCFFKRVAK